MGSVQLKEWRKEGVGDGPSPRMSKSPRVTGDAMGRKTVSQVLKSSMNEGGVRQDCK